MDDKKINKEQLQVDLFNRFESEKNKAFEVALEGDKMMHVQFMNDFNILIATLQEWSDKAKSEEQKKTIMDMVASVFRIHTFAEGRHTLSKRAVAEKIVNGRQLTKSLLEVQETRKEMETIRQQIKFHEANK